MRAVWAGWLLLTLPLSAETWVVAAGGDDAGAGSAVAPLATLGEALHRVEKRKAGSAEIVVRAGVYPVAQSLNVTASHASKERGGLVIRAEGQAILSGFRAIPPTAWKKPDAETLAKLVPEVRSRVLESPLSDAGQLSRRGFNVAEVRESPPALLFVNGQPMTLARWPDDEWAKPGKVLDVGPTRDGSESEDFYKRGGSFQFSNSRLKSWATEKNLWVEGTFGYDWEWSFNRVKRVDIAGQSIQLAAGEVSGLMEHEWLHPGFRVVNALSEITRPGEYHFDQVGKRLLLLPPADERWRSSATMTGSAGPLLKVAGASGLRMEGITLEGARDGLMEIKDGTGITLRNVTFRRNGGDGLVAEGQEISLTGCVFEDCGGTALKLTGGKEITLESSGHVVERCTFLRNAWWSKVFQPSVALEGVGHRVSDCRFEDLPHMAIEVKGNNFVIERSLFRRVCRDFRDMGAVYFNLGEKPLRRGSIVRGNFFDDIGRAGGNRSAVYLDNAKMGVRVEGNLFRGVGATAEDWTVMIHGGGYNRVRGNVFIDCSQPCEVAFLFATWAKGQLPEYQRKWTAELGASSAKLRLKAYPELTRFKQEDAVHPPGIVIEGNRVFHSGDAAPKMVRVEGGKAEDVRQANNIVQRFTGVTDLPPFAEKLLEVWK